MTEPTGDPVATRPRSAEPAPRRPRRRAGERPAAAARRRSRPTPASSGPFAGELLQTAATVPARPRRSSELGRGRPARSSIRPRRRAPRGSQRPRRRVAGGSARLPNAVPEDDGVLYLIDQRRLPDALVEYPCRSAGEVAFAIREMIIRGAPAIGQAAAIGMALTAEKMRGRRDRTLGGRRSAARPTPCHRAPTAVNLRWAVDRMMARYDGDRRPVRGRRRDRRRACAPRPTRSSSRPPPITGGWPTSACGAPDARGPARPHPDPLQHRAARGRPVRDGAGRRPGRAQRRPRGPRLGRRDPPVLQGARLDGLGAGPGGRRPTPHPGCRGRAPDGPRARSTSSWSAGTGSRPTATPPTRSARTRWRCSQPATGSRSTSSRRHQLGRPRHARRHDDPDRGAQGRGGPRVSRRALAPPGTEVRNPPSTSRRPS